MLKLLALIATKFLAEEENGNSYLVRFFFLTFNLTFLSLFLFQNISKSMAPIDVRLILVSVHSFHMLYSIARKVKLLPFYFPEETMLNFTDIVWFTRIIICEV